jgi:uncharacterized membrane protein
MTTNMSRWVVPAVGFVLGLLIAAALLGRHASLGQAAVAFVIVAGYAIALRVLQSRSDMASLLSGLPRDERWESINLRALSLAGQLIAVVLVGAFLVAQFGGGDSMPYAWVGAVFGVGYLGGLLWYRSRS